MGCDYCESIRGIGPKRAIELIRQFNNIETVLQNIDTKKYVVPENWNYEAARALFVNPDVADPETIDVIFIIGLFWKVLVFIYCTFFFS